MKSLSIYTLTRNQSIEHISKLERQLSGRKFPLKIRTWEWGSMRALAAQLEMYESSCEASGITYGGGI